MSIGARVGSQYARLRIEQRDDGGLQAPAKGAAVQHPVHLSAQCRAQHEATLHLWYPGGPV